MHVYFPQSLLLLFALLLATGPLHAATLYLCKAYSGSTFWTALPCSQQRATTVETYEVPSRTTLEEQIAHAERTRKQRTEATRTIGLTGFDTEPVQGSEKECASHKEALQKLDQIERQVPRTMSLDAIRTERGIRRDRMSQLRCR